MITTLYKIFQRWGEKGSLYIYSDPHFGDSDCVFMDRNWPEPKDQLAMLNKGLSKNDTLVILGDVGDVTYVSQLKAGYKVLIMGNHDGGRTKYERKIRKYEYDFPTLEDAKKALRCHVIDSYCFVPTQNGTGIYEGFVDNRLFDEVYEGPLMISEKIILSHEPICLTAGITCNPVAVNIHGHDHGGELSCDEYHLNVCANVVGYRKISLSQLIKDGLFSNINSVHREIIDLATAKKQNRIEENYDGCMNQEESK